MRILLLAAATAMAASLTVAAQNPPADAPPQSPPADEHPKLPPGEGRDLTIRVCSSCHEVEKVADQEYDPAGWKDVVDQMAAQGADGTDAELDQIVQYLARAFPPQ